MLIINHGPKPFDMRVFNTHFGWFGIPGSSRGFFGCYLLDFSKMMSLRRDYLGRRGHGKFPSLLHHNLKIQFRGSMSQVWCIKATCLSSYYPINTRLVYEARARPVCTEELNIRPPFTSCLSKSSDLLLIPYPLFPHAKRSRDSRCLINFCRRHQTPVIFPHQHDENTLYFTEGTAPPCLSPRSDRPLSPPPPSRPGPAGPGPTHLGSGQRRAKAAGRPPRPAPPPWPRRCPQQGAAAADTALKDTAPGRGRAGPPRRGLEGWGSVTGSGCRLTSSSRRLHPSTLAAPSGPL